MKRNLWQSCLAALGLLVLILDSALALEGARAGLDLCIRTVIPSLLPFFILSMLLTGSLSGSPSRPVLVLSDFLSVPQAAAPVLIPAFLGGYPVGAKCVADLFRKNRISKPQAQRLLAFCSNAGPSFLFGMVSLFFPEKKQIWLLWCIQIASAVFTAMAIPAPKLQPPSQTHTPQREEPDILLSSVRAMAIVCCWVILFRILIAFLERWFLWMLPASVQVLVMGFLELTNGCCALHLIPEEAVRFVLCACMLSWGGLCVLLQTAGVTKGLSLAGYLKGKLLQTVFAFLLSCMAVYRQGWMMAFLILPAVIIFRKSQNRYGNPGIYPV